MAYAWQARHGLTSAQYQAEFDSLLAQGFRLIDVNGYGVNGVNHYAVVWEQSPGPAWQARHGISSADHQSLFDTLPSEGYRPVCVSGYDDGGDTRYTAIWNRGSALTWQARHGLPAPNYQTEFDALLARGFRLVKVNGFAPGGRLIEAGQLNLGDRVFGANGILGTTFGTQPYGPNIDHITVQHLLEHTSGWAHNRPAHGGRRMPLEWVLGQLFGAHVDHGHRRERLCARSPPTGFPEW